MNQAPMPTPPEGEPIAGAVRDPVATSAADAATAPPPVPPAHFAPSARLLHWAMALMLLSMVFVGATMVETLAVWQPALVRAHQAAGVLALALVLLRLLNRWRLRGRSPALPADLPPLQRLAARAPIARSTYGLIIAGIRPMRTSVRQNFASNEATAMSQAATSPMPPAKAGPCTRATVGLGASAIRRSRCASLSESASFSAGP